MAAPGTGDKVGGVGYLSPQTYHYWRGTSQVSEPYEAFVPHRIAGWALQPDPGTLFRLGAADGQLRAVQSEVRQSPALSWCLNRTEAIASSSVEGIRTTLRSLSLLESMRAHRSAQRAEADLHALGNTRLHAFAADLGQRRSAALRAADIEEMHRRLFAGTTEASDAGRLRSEQNWIGHRAERTPARAHFVPPPPELVESLLADTMEFVSTPPWLAVLAKAAISHLQFETIHPFDDGNGRVGRALMHCVLHRDLTMPVPLPLSAAIDARREDYVAALRPYQTYIGGASTEERSQAARQTIRYIADAAAVACYYVRVAAQAVADMERTWADLRLRSDSAATAILKRMSTMPAAGVEYLCAATGRSPRAVRRAVATLCARGALSETVDEATGRRALEMPQMLRIVDQRHDLLNDCWELHRSGTPNVASVAAARFAADA